MDDVERRKNSSERGSRRHGQEFPGPRNVLLDPELSLHESVGRFAMSKTHEALNNPHHVYYDDERWLRNRFGGKGNCNLEGLVVIERSGPP